MIYKCQHKERNGAPFHVHHVEAKDEATARVIMFNRCGGSPAWLDLEQTLVWSDEDWTAL